MRSLKVKDLKVKDGYKKVEYLVYDKETNRTYLAIGKRIPLKLFKKLHDEDYVCSYKYYDDTHSISIIACKDEVACYGEDKNVVIRLPNNGMIIYAKENKNEIWQKLHFKGVRVMTKRENVDLSKLKSFDELVKIHEEYKKEEKERLKAEYEKLVKESEDV